VKGRLSGGIKTTNTPEATAYFQVSNLKKKSGRTPYFILRLDLVSLEWIMCVGNSKHCEVKIFFLKILHTVCL
jgi:hypothetical protein